MAIWQFRLVLIPEESLRVNCGSVPTSIAEDLAEDFSWWGAVQPPTGFEGQIDGILPKAVSWSDDMKMWGNEHSDTAWVGYDEGGRVEFIEFKIDVRNCSPDFTKDICRFAEELKCVLLTREYHLIKPDKVAVNDAINHSVARQFVKDPISTLRGLKSKKILP